VDSVVVLDNGSVADVGSYEQLKLRSATLMEKVSSVIEDSEANGEDDENDGSNSDDTSPVAADDDQSMVTEQDGDDKRDRSWAVYSYYCRSASALSLILWGAFTFIGAIASSATSRFCRCSCLKRDAYSLLAILVQKWTEANEEHPNQQLGFYLGIYAMLVVVALGSVSGECW